MGLIFSLIHFFIKLLLYLAVFVAIIVVIPNLPPYTKFTSVPLEPTLERTGSLAPNGLLNNAQKLYEGKIVGPEAFQIYNGELYTSLATGEIVKVSAGGHVTFVTKIGKPCSGLTQEHVCGRPLGFQIDEKTNILYVADAYYGIWKIDLKTEKKQLLVSPRVVIEGREPKLFNSLALTQNGDFYWIDSSSDFHLKDGALSVLTDPSGRILHYNAAKNQSKVILDNLWFPNSIVLSSDNQFILISETCRFRLIKYYLDGPKKGKSEIFAAGLPGIPDNIRALPDNSGVLVALYTVFDDEHPLITRPMSETPLLRKFLVRLQRLIEMPFEYLNNIYPHFLFDEVVYKIGHFSSVSVFLPPLTGLLYFDWSGKIVASYFNTDESLRHISDAIVYNGKLYTARPHDQNFIGSVPAPSTLLKAFSIKEPQIPATATPENKRETPKVGKPLESRSSSPPPQVKPDSTQKPASQTPSDKKSVTGNTPPESTPESVKITPTTAKPPIKHTPTPEIKPVSKPATGKPDIKPTAIPEAKPIPKSEIKSTPKPVTKPLPKQDTKSTIKQEAKPSPSQEAKPSAKQEAKPTPKQEVKPTPKQDAKPVLKQESKASPTQEIKPTPKQELKPSPKQEFKPSPKQDTKPSPTQETKQTSQPEVKTTKSSKDAETRATGGQQDIKNKNEEQEKIDVGNAKFGKPISKEIPIKEDIPSDTKKPNTGKLKVIKKEGPTEIPHPEL